MKVGVRAGERHEAFTSATTATGEIARVEQRSAAFRKELGLADLVLQQIVYVVGIVWVGAAAKLAQSHIVFWLAAMLLFYLPQAAVVIHLSRALPLEGGLYQWTKLGFGEAAGFMVAWNLWMYAVVLISSIGLPIASNFAYAFDAPWLASSKSVIVGISCALMGALIALGILGLSVSKWLHNAGSVMLLIAFAVLIGLPFVQHARGVLPEYHPFAFAMPTLTLLSLNIFGKLAVGALSGFEYVAVLAGECRDPERTIGRATLIAAPIIAVMFILGTSSVLAFVRPENIDLIGPIPQVLSIGSRPFGIAASIVPVAILMVMCMRLAQASVNFTANTRLPMVAGWDHLLPAWFTRLHAKYRTPVNSILFVGVMILAMGLAGIAGVGEQEAYQLLQNAAGSFYAITYLVMFAIPIVGLRGVNPRPSPWLKIAAGSGFLMTLLYVVVSVFPIVQVKSQASFTAKVSGVIIAANIIGAAIFLFAERRRRGRALKADSVGSSAD